MSLKPRVIPVLLIHKGGLYKTKQFKNPIYVGDPINAVKIFNEKEVDELLIFDIDCTKDAKEPNYDLIKSIVSEAFMPIGYGGGIKNFEQAQKLFSLGIEKVVLNDVLNTNPKIINEIAAIYGNQSVVACIDYKKIIFVEERVFFNSGTQKSKFHPLQWAKYLEELGVGEIILNSIQREGMYLGFDNKLIATICSQLKIPLVASGGASTVDDFRSAIQSGASAVAGGSIFVYKRPHNAVLINYLTKEELIWITN